LRKPPEETSDAWKLTFESEPYQFDVPVSRELNGTPLKSQLAAIPRGRLRNVATQGRAVRSIPIGDALRILSVGDPGAGILLLDTGKGESPSESGATNVPPERKRRQVSALERDAEFRRKIIRAYAVRCAVTGLGDGSGRGLEAAHMQPAGAGHRGPDAVENGICLTPTVHRLFDLGLIGLIYKGSELILVTSLNLELSECSDESTGANLGFSSGSQVRLPQDSETNPGREFVEYHHKHVFRRK
jgi:hypothetical protein